MDKNPRCTCIAVYEKLTLGANRGLKLRGEKYYSMKMVTRRKQDYSHETKQNSKPSIESMVAQDLIVFAPDPTTKIGYPSQTNLPWSDVRDLTSQAKGPRRCLAYVKLGACLQGADSGVTRFTHSFIHVTNRAPIMCQVALFCISEQAPDLTKLIFS